MAVTIKTKSAPIPITLYRFGSVTDGNASMKNELGGKGANLAEMSALGIPVPPGFTIPCDASVKYQEVKHKPASLAAFNVSLESSVSAGLLWLQSQFDEMPLVSIRSGARVSMPGMMDTILNVGITSENLPEWKNVLGERVALDCYRRLIQMYCSVALEIPLEKFEAVLESVKQNVGVKVDSELDASALSRVVSKYLTVVAEAGKAFPDSVEAQVNGAIKAVFNSWNNPRAVEYRKIHGYSDSWGTAVNIQSMVFGNKDNNSATGVLFSRNMSTGENSITGEFLVNAQGEDVVAGIRTPLPMTEFGPMLGADLEGELFGIVEKLEAHYKDMQDIEFTIQSGKLYILQTRNGKRSPLAAFKIAHDLAIEGVITQEEAVSRVSTAQLLSAMSDTIDPKFTMPPAMIGIAAGGGLVTGIPVFSAEDAVNCTEPCILVTKETNPDDIAGMHASVGILTATGGLTSHAAVVARGMSKACVVGCTELNLYFAQSTWSGCKITIDGSTGNVWANVNVPVISGSISPEAKALVSWSKAVGGSERLEINYKLSMSEMIKVVTSTKAKSIYVDTALLEAPERDDDKLKSKMIDLGVALLHSEADTITVDMTPLDQVLTPADLIFTRMCGMKYDGTNEIAVKYIAVTGWDSALASKVIFKFSSSAENVENALVKLGYRVYKKVETFSDLLHASGPVKVSDEVLASVFGSVAAFEAAKKMVEESMGKKLSGDTVPPSYWYEFNGKAA